MKKIFISAVIIVAFVGYFWFQQQSQAGVDIIPSISATPSRTPNPTSLPVATGTPNPTVGPTSVPTQKPTATPKPLGLYKDGVYTSQTADAGYGPVQIRVTVSGGKMTNVQFLQYPTDANHSRQVSSYSTPILSQEAIIAQSAKVDTVSGATATSEAFIQALAGVLSGIRT